MKKNKKIKNKINRLITSTTPFLLHHFFYM